MDFYIFTSEFWLNMLYGVLMGVSVCVGLVLTIGCTSCDGGFWKLSGVGAFIAFVFVFPCKLVDHIQYDRLKEGKRGPVAILRKEYPMLYEDFTELERLREKEMALVGVLESEKSRATTDSARGLYDKQLAEAGDRLKMIKKMWWRINNIATDIYFSSYLDKLDQRIVSTDFQRELQTIKQECDKLMKLHAIFHE